MPRRRRLRRGARALLPIALVVLIAVALATTGFACNWWRRPTPKPPPQIEPPPVVEEPPPVTPPPVTPPPQPILTGGIIDFRNAIPIVTKGPAGGNRVALTFDAGWEFVQTGALLAALDKEAIHATFFLRGGWVEAHPDLARQIAAAGHEIESHSYAHSDMAKLTEAQVKDDLDRDQAAAVAALGHSPDYFRPPYGAWSPSLLRQLADYGIKASIMWTIDTLDWKGVSADDIVAKTATATDGAIILMHIGGANTIEALPRIVANLRAKGLTPATLVQLLGDRLTRPR